MSKTLYFVGSSLVLGIGAYAAYKYYKLKDAKCIDEGFEDTNKLEDNPDRKVLVLGLENAGKTTIVNRIARLDEVVKPTEGFVVTPMEIDNTVFNVWEIGGKESVRKYWSTFLQDTDLLIFVVDASDSHNLPLAVKELKAVVGDERLNHVPVIVVANKFNLPRSMSVQEIQEALDVRSIESYKHKIKVMGIVTNERNHESIDCLRKAIKGMAL